MAGAKRTTFAVHVDLPSDANVIAVLPSIQNARGLVKSSVALVRHDGGGDATVRYSIEAAKTPCEPGVGDIVATFVVGAKVSLVTSAAVRHLVPQKNRATEDQLLRTRAGPH